MVPSHGSDECESHDVELPVGHNSDHVWVLVRKLVHMLARIHLVVDGLALAYTSIDMASVEYNVFLALNI